MTAQEAILQENELIQGLRDRRQETLRHLYAHYGPALYGVIHHIIPSQKAAEELLQECFAKIWQDIHTYDHARGRLFTWMLNIARRLAIGKSRRFHLDQPSRTANTLRAGYNSNADEDVTIPEHIDLPFIVSRLRPEQRDLIDVIYFYGYTQAEAAQKLKIPLGTVKTRVRAAVRELRKLFIT